jgi:type I restriction enzyme S subunit
MNRYQSYKPSGVEWIGDIPEHWEIIRMGMLGIFSSSGIDKKLDDNETSVRMVNYTDIIKSRVHNPIINNQIDFMVVTTPQSKLEEHKLRKGDLVFLPSSETCEDLGVSSLIDFDENDIVYSYHILRFKFLKEINHYFKKYLGNHNSVYNQFSLEGKGTTRQIIGRNVFRNVKVVLPPISEQHQIVQFLDEKTELIDKLILTKERKITLLKEQRTSLINQVVTNGLNTNVKMKDSGVEWIGEIPEHWRFIKFSYLISKSDLGGNYDSSSEGDGLPLMKMGNLGRGKINLKKIEYLNNDEYDISHKLEHGDFLFNTRNSIDLVGKVSLWRNELEFSLYNSNILRISFKNGVDNEFMCYLFNSQSILDVLKLISKGTTSVSGIYYKDLSEIKICIPSIEEQLQIVEYLDSKTKEIDDLVQLEQKKIDLLKQYRQSLISEVVTGKIKVTN